MDIRKSHEIFAHICEEPGCDTTVVHNDAPYCKTHTIEHPEGLGDYSAKDRNANLTVEDVKQTHEDAAPERRNIFEK